MQEVTREAIQSMILFLWAPMIPIAATVLFSYAKAWKHRKLGLLPIHVAIISVSYLVLATRVAWQVILATTLSWFSAGVALFALITGLAALIIIVRYEQLRVREKEKRDTRDVNG